MINASYGGMSSAADSTRHISNALEQQLEALQARVRAEAASWDGESKLAFEFQMNRWSNAMAALTGTEAAAARSIVNSSHLYQATDQRNSRLIGGV